jgi:adenine-specific DNA-methyltransferase
MSNIDELPGQVDDDNLWEEKEQGAHLIFSGKSMAKRLYRKVQPRTSRRLAKFSVGSEEEQACNQVIEGENLQAMVTLYRERGQVDLILTDPPYNTGKDFRYNDRWDEDPNDPALGQLIAVDDPGRHTKWMRFMWPRLKVMQAMLKPSGVLAICIDHRELFRLGQMLDEIFDEDNRVAILNWQKSATRRNDQHHVSTATEYVLVYTKGKDLVRTSLLDRSDALNASYKNPDNDAGGLWWGVAPWGPSRATHMGMVYAIQSPFTGELYYPPGSRCWGFEKLTIKRWLEQWGSEYEERDLSDGYVPALLLKDAADPRTLSNSYEDPVVRQALDRAEKIRDTKKGWPQLIFTRNGFGKPRKKAYLEKVKKGIVPDTFWADDDYFDPINIGCVSWESSDSGTSEAGARELSAIVGDNHGFETVKPLKLFTKIIQLWCPPSGLVVDPFAGSGTTGHAILALNAKIESSERRFILIEQGRPEKGDPYARSLLADRLQRAITGNWTNGKGEALGSGYRFVQLQNKVDAKVLLEMERDEMTDTVIASHYDANRRGGPSLIIMTNENYSHLVARNSSGEGFYLVWGGTSAPPVFTEDVYDAVVAEAIKAGLKPFYHVYARFNLFQSDDVHFYQIPDQILMDFGLDLNDAFNNEAGDW